MGKKIIGVCLTLILCLTCFACLSACDNDGHDADVDNVTLVSISVKSLSLKSEYYIGAPLDVSGGILIATYSDGSEKEIEITADMVSGFDSSTKGEKKYTIEYETKSVLYSYTVLDKVNPDNPTPSPDILYFTSSEDSNGNLIITGLKDQIPSKLIFPATIDGKRVISIDGNTKGNISAFAEEFITEIEIEDGIEMIGDYTFSNCVYLSKVTLPDSLTKMGKNVFENCTRLRDVNFGHGLTYLDKETFISCTALENVALPSTLQAIGESAFNNCKALREINLPDSLTVVERMAFRDCALNSINLKNVQIISESMFLNCKLLSKVEVPKALVVDKSAFASTRIDSIDLPLVTRIGYRAFGSSDLKSITLPSVTTLEEYAFDSSKIESVVLSDSLVSMGMGCFMGCKELMSVKFDSAHSNLLAIPEYAFAECRYLRNFTIGDNVTSIGKNAFYKSGLSGTINMPDSVSTIGSYAFQESSISGLIFGNKSKLTTNGLGHFIADGVNLINIIRLPNGINQIDSNWFGHCGLETLDLSQTKITNVPFSAFSTGYHKNLRTVLLPDVCTSIDQYAFSDLSRLEQVSGLGVRKVKESAFKNCTELNAANFLGKLEKIESNAFGGCKSLKEVTFGSGLQYIENSSFQGCSSITNVNIPSNVLRIGDGAFQKCSSLENVVIASGVKKIGNNAFENCSSLVNIVIPSGVNTIGESLLLGCSSLKTVTLGITDLSAFGAQTSLGWDDINNMRAIYVPQAQLDEYKAKFAYMSNIIKPMTV